MTAEKVFSNSKFRIRDNEKGNPPLSRKVFILKFDFQGSAKSFIRYFRFTLTLFSRIELSCNRGEMLFVLGRLCAYRDFFQFFLFFFFFTIILDVQNLNHLIKGLEVIHANETVDRMVPLMKTTKPEA